MASMMKRMMMSGVGIALMLLMATTAWAETINDVKYIDENGEEKTANNVTVLTGNETTLGTDNTTTWYVCNTAVDTEHPNGLVYNSTLTLNGDVNIIILDGTTLSVGTPDRQISGEGITSNNSICFYGQANATGKIYVNSQKKGIYTQKGSINIIYCDVDVNVDENNTGGGDNGYYGIGTYDSDSDIKIFGRVDGNNTVKVRCYIYGIKTLRSSVTISNCDVDVNCTYWKAIESSKSITITGRPDGSNTVNLKSGQYALFTSGAITIKYCTLNAITNNIENENSYQIYGNGGFTFEGVEDNGSNRLNKLILRTNSAGIESSSSLTITNSDIIITGSTLTDGVYGNNCGGCAIQASGALTLTGRTDGSNTLTIHSNSTVAGIYGGDVTISNYKYDFINKGGQGIKSYSNGTITINGLADGSIPLKLNSKGYGISGLGTVTIKDCDIDINSTDGDGIYTTGDINITSRNIDITSALYGINCSGSLTITGLSDGSTTVKISSSKDGIHGSAITIKDCDIDINSTDGKGIIGTGAINITGLADGSKTVKITSKGNGIDGSGAITITDCDIDINSTDGKGIIGTGAINITGLADGSKTVKITSKGNGIDGSDAINITDCDIDINSTDGKGIIGTGAIKITGLSDGSTTVKLNSKGNGIDGSDAINITDCDIDINSTDDKGIVENGDNRAITITGLADGSSTATIHSKSTLATIYNTKGSFTISNCKADISNTNTGRAIWAKYITIDGGQVKATAPQEKFGIFVENGGTLTLGWNNAEKDFIQASSYKSYSGTMMTAAGKRFVAYDAATGTAASCIIGDATSATTISTADLTTIAGKILRPIDSNLLQVEAKGITPSGYNREFTLTTGEGENTVTTHYYVYKADDDVTLTLPNLGQDYVSLTTRAVGESDDATNDLAVTTADNVATATLAIPAKDVIVTGMKSYDTGVKYLDWDDSKKKLVEATTPEGTKVWILDGTEEILGTAGTASAPTEAWYIAKGNVSYDHQLKNASHCDIHLILADGCNMTVGTEEHPITGSDQRAIYIQDADFTIYGQSTGDNMGSLTAVSQQRNGIVAKSELYNCSFTINGGKVTATSQHEIGIVAMSVSDNSSFTINGGIVTATSKGDKLGISVESFGQNVSFTINGGQVTANGNYNGYSVQVYTSRGTATLSLGWTEPTDFIKVSGFGISNPGTAQTAAGKRFVAYDPVGEGETELAASCIIGDATSNEPVTISSADLSTIAGKTLRPLDGYWLTSSVVPADRTDKISETNPKGADFTLTTGEGENTVTTPYYVYKASTEENPVSVAFAVEDRGQDGVEIMGTNVPTNVTLSSDRKQASFAMPAKDVTVTGMKNYATGVDYLDWDDTEKKLVEKNTATDDNAANDKVYILDGTETTLGTAGSYKNPPKAWYIAKGNLSYNHRLKNANYCDIHLILADGCDMSVGTEENPITDNSNNAIRIEYADFTIYGQSTDDNRGKLTAVGNGISIIVRNNPAKDGFLTINGGQVTAKGSIAIYVEINNKDNIGGITINGGKVTANGTRNGIYASINENSGYKAILTINGGEVYATISEGYRAGIISDNDIIITGGHVEAKNNHMIGNAISCKEFAITGGQVEAIGGSNVYGIYTWNDDITLSWTDYSDYIKASSYYVFNTDNVVKIAAGKYFIIDGTETILGSVDKDYVLSDDDLDAVEGKKLLPVVGIATGGVKYLAFTDNDGNRKLLGDDVQVYVVTGYDLAKGKAYLKAVEGNVIPKGLPVVIGNKTEDGDLPANIFILGGDDSQTTVEGLLKNYVSCDGTQTVQAYLDKIFGEGASLSEYIPYLLTGGTFKSVDVKAKDVIKKDVCLLFIPKWDVLMGKSAGTTNAGTRSIGIGNGETTSLTPSPSPKGEGSDWYDLLGRKIKKPTKKGIYILNGKMVKK